MADRIGRAVAFACVLLTGCAAMGPATVARDRFDYVTTMSDSWKRQLLINLVKVRYADAPIFLDVVSVINSYSWEAEGSLGAQVSSPASNGRTLNLGAVGRYADRPTISYAPLSGEKFVRSLMAPLPVNGILSLVQGGYRADVVLRICASRVNGLDNAYGNFGAPRAGSAGFEELLMLLRAAQAAGRLDAHPKSPGGDAMVLVLGRPGTPEEAAHDRRLRELLGLDPDASEFEVVHGAFTTGRRQIAILARSMQQVLTDAASYIQVPEADVTEGRVYALARSEDELRRYPAPVRVHSGPQAPGDAHVAVPYRGHHFWIDDRDAVSKNVFNFLLLLFSLTETGIRTGPPVLTIPAH